jgi:hypothetical protein
MKIEIEVQDQQEADAVRAAWADPTTRVLILTVGILQLLPTDRDRARILRYVEDKLAEYDEAARGRPVHTAELLP